MPGGVSGLLVTGQRAREGERHFQEPLARLIDAAKDVAGLRGVFAVIDDELQARGKLSRCIQGFDRRIGIHNGDYIGRSHEQYIIRRGPPLPREFGWSVASVDDDDIDVLAERLKLAEESLLLAGCAVGSRFGTSETRDELNAAGTALQDFMNVAA